MQNIKRIAITGGPCGGKSTFLAKVHEWLESYGIIPLVVSETATELINSGITPGLVSLARFEELLLEYQIRREEIYLAAAHKIATEKNRQVVILCDRGTMDVAAYVEKEEFARICNEFNCSAGNLMSKYNLVVHLTTAAIGAEEHYTLANNAARTEGIEEARKLDEKTRLAWLGHPHHIIVGNNNQTGFDAKMLRGLQSLSRVLNMPIPTEIERKFLFLNFDPSLIPSDAVAIQITQDYLVSDGIKERRVRLSEMDGQRTFYYTEKTETDSLGARHEQEVIISQEKYANLLKEKDPDFKTIKKIRYCFFSGHHKFELDVYFSPVGIIGLVVLEVEVANIGELIIFPIGWKLQDVTGEDKYKNKNLAR